MARQGAGWLGLRRSMALSAKLTMRQGQTMVLTPQLLQAIKLLQMPNVELSAFIESELQSNPLLERAEERDADEGPDRVEPEWPAAPAETAAEPGDWASEGLETDASGLAANLGTELENAFEPDFAAPVLAASPPDGLTASAWTGVGGGGSDTSYAPELEAYAAETSRCANIWSARPASSSLIRSNG